MREIKYKEIMWRFEIGVKGEDEEKRVERENNERNYEERI